MKFRKSFIYRFNNIYYDVMMIYKELIGKVIADRNSKKIGLCLHINESVKAGPNGDEPLHTMILKIERPFKGPLKIEVEVGKILKIEGIYAWIDTTKKEIFDALKNTKQVKKANSNIISLDLSILKNYKPPPPST
ncbi:MAG: hypothetical protein FK733_15095 [Asgard group archaeon]|nr:hypothetical protein [Asgard group archaeon]